MKEVKERIRVYFKGYENADIMTCGCGCNAELDVPHGIIQRVEKDITKIIEGVAEDKPK